MTTESHSPAGTEEPAFGPPPGCPAHGIGPGDPPGGLRRLYGPEAEDLGALYEKLRAWSVRETEASGRIRRARS